MDNSRRVLRCLLCLWVCFRRRPQRHNYSRFTAPFANPVKSADELNVSAADKEEGWEVVPDPRAVKSGSGKDERFVWVRRWMKNGTSRGVPVFAGDLMLTWQVCRDGVWARCSFLPRTALPGMHPV